MRFAGIAGLVADYAERVSVVSISRDIDRDFVDMRRHVREFALTGNAADSNAAGEIATRVENAIARGVATIQDPGRKQRMQQIATQFDAYRARHRGRVRPEAAGGRGGARRA